MPVGTGIRGPGFVRTDGKTVSGRSKKRFCIRPEYWGEDLKDALYAERASRNLED